MILKHLKITWSHDLMLFNNSFKMQMDKLINKNRKSVFLYHWTPPSLCLQSDQG